MTVAMRPRSTTRATPSRGPAGGVVAEIAARRIADLEPELAAVGRARLDQAAAAAPAPRDLVERLARPGLHLIAEVKRRSPSAGPIAAPDEDPVARALAYERGGASAISVLCEPHWFGGSIGDLAAVRAAVSLPVLAKEFVVDVRQLPLLRAAGADAVLLLAVLHPARRLSALVDAALDLGLEPLVEAHDVRELDRAIATRARMIGLNNRDLRTLDVDPERSVRLRGAIPDDRIAVAESGVREPATVAGWRAAGFDAALVGEALMCSADPAAAARAFVAAGSFPVDPAVAGRLPMVKICGVVDPAGIHAAIRAGADAIGLNVVAGTPRALDLDEAASLAGLVRATAPAGSRPRIVAVTADTDVDRLRAIVGAIDPDVVQLNADVTPAFAASLGRPTWKALHLPATEPTDVAGAAAAIVERGRAFLAAGVDRLLLDTAGGPHPGGTGTRSAPALAAAVARELPVVLAGGLSPANVGPALLEVPAVGVDVASGVEAPRIDGQRPRKDPLRVALFAKRARAARVDRPNIASRPTPVDPGLLDADAAGRWGIARDPERVLARSLAVDPRGLDPGRHVDPHGRDLEQRRSRRSRGESPPARTTGSSRATAAARAGAKRVPVPPGCGPPAVSRSSRSTPAARKARPRSTIAAAAPATSVGSVAGRWRAFQVGRPSDPPTAA